jgi:eukaryotic-like serine/threonine-protein kinase
VQLRPGLQVGPYQVLSVLGAGGMAEVYRARDTRLGREVALKVVNAALATDPELVQRFEQEARVAGALRHPNLVAVYDVGRHDGVPYFVTELLEGESLRHRLTRGRVPYTTALEWGIQLARGLAAAHARGVIHRDVKPDNVFVGADGQVKLLDFGIAKLAEAAERHGPRGLMDHTLAPGGSATRTGAVLGSPGYMSPEQVRGEPLDARSDLFSLGAVLHELLSAGRAFPGSSVIESGYAILHHDPAPLPEELPVQAAQLVHRCLEKDPTRRFQSAADLAFALEVLRGGAFSGPDRTPTSLPRVPRRTSPLLAVGLAAGLILAAGAFAWSRRGPPVLSAPPTVEQVTFRWGALRAARFASDGRVIYSAAFEGRPEEVFTRPPGSAISQPLGLPGVRLAAVSPTGELAVLLAPKWVVLGTSRGTLARVPGVGGIPRQVAENVEYADFSPTGELAMVVSRGTARVLEYPRGTVLFQTEGFISDPRFSRRGDRIAFVHHPVSGDTMGELAVVDLEGKAKVLSPRYASLKGVAWSPADAEIWFTAGELQRNLIRAVGLDGRMREVYRAPSDLHLDDIAGDGSVLLTNQFERAEVQAVDADGHQALLSWTEWANSAAAISRDRKALFTVASPVVTPTGQQPALAVLRSMDGSPAQVLGEGDAVDLSPDGRWALIRTEGRDGLLAVPTGPGLPRQFSLGELRAWCARWLPDGKRIVLTARAGSGPYRLHELDPERGPPRLLSDVPLGTQPILVLSPDGLLAAAVDLEDRPVVVALSDGATSRVPGLPPRSFPRGWAAPRELWFTQGADLPDATRLFRVDIDTGKVLEERKLGPPDSSGATALAFLELSSDGREVVYTFNRFLGHLYILRGLSPPSR